MHDSVLSHRERVRRALEHKDTDRVPISLICSGINQPTLNEFHQFLKRERGIELGEFLRKTLDVRPVWPKYSGPQQEKNTDHWGVRRKTISFGSGSYSDEIDLYPLANASSIDDVVKHPWPSTDWFDYTEISEQIKRTNEKEEFCIISGWGSIFEASWYMRGFEQFLMDLILNPELTNCIMENVAKFQIEFTRRILEGGNGEIDMIFTADDLGTQNGLMMSPDIWEQNIKPHHVELNKTVHEFGAKVIYHTDGAIMKAVPGLIDMGIDILQALQFDAAEMDPQVLKDEYGDRLCFEGGVSVQKTLPFGTVDDVRQETQELVRVLGQSGGYILGPSHYIQAGTPVENILAMFDTALQES